MLQLKAYLQSWHFINCRFSLLSREHVIHFIFWSAEWYLKDAIKKTALLILTWSSIFLHSCKLLCNCMSIENYNKESKGFTLALNHLLGRIIHSSTLNQKWNTVHWEMNRIIKGWFSITSLKDIMQPKTLQECLAGPQAPDRQSYRTQTLSEYIHTHTRQTL